MIVDVYGRSGPGSPGSRRCVDALQPRDHDPGAGRQGGARARAAAPGARVAPGQARALAGGHRAVDPRLAAAGARAAAGSTGARAAGAGDRPARAAVLRPANTRRAAGTDRAHRDGGDPDRRRRHQPQRAPAHDRPHLLAPDDHRRAVRAGGAQPASLSDALAAAHLADDHDARRRLCLCVDRSCDQARRRRPRHRTSRGGDRLGARDGRGLRRGAAQRDERPAGTPGHPGGAGRVRHPDGRASGACAVPVRRALQRHAALRRSADRGAGAADRRRHDARALPAAAGAYRRRAQQLRQRLDGQPLRAQPRDDPLEPEDR